MVVLGLKFAGAATVPVGALLGVLALQVKDRGRRQQVSIGPFPLEGELHIAPFRVPLIHGILEVVLGDEGTVEELEEPDGCIAELRVDKPGTEIQFGQLHHELVAVEVIEVIAAHQGLISGPAHDILAVGTIDAVELQG